MKNARSEVGQSLNDDPSSNDLSENGQRANANGGNSSSLDCQGEKNQCAMKVLKSYNREGAMSCCYWMATKKAPWVLMQMQSLLEL